MTKPRPTRANDSGRSTSAAPIARRPRRALDVGCPSAIAPRNPNRPLGAAMRAFPGAGLRQHVDDPGPRRGEIGRAGRHRLVLRFALMERTKPPGPTS